MREILKKREFTLLLLIAVMLLLIVTQAPSFVSPENILRIINDTSILIMVSIGQFMVILTGGIDLSVGSIIAFSGMAASMMNQYYPEMPVLLILFAWLSNVTVLTILLPVCIATFSIGAVLPITMAAILEPYKFPKTIDMSYMLESQENYDRFNHEPPQSSQFRM